MCGVQLKDRKRSAELMLMLGLSETIDQLAMANSVCLYGHVLMREDGLVLRRALDSKIEGQRKNGRPKRKWEKQVDEESLKIGLRRKDALCRSRWSVGVDQIAAGLRSIWPPLLVLDPTTFYASVCLSLQIPKYIYMYENISLCISAINMYV